MSIYTCGMLYNMVNKNHYPKQSHQYDWQQHDKQPIIVYPADLQLILQQGHIDGQERDETRQPFEELCHYYGILYSAGGATKINCFMKSGLQSLDID